MTTATATRAIGPGAEPAYPPVIWLLLGGNLMVRAAGFAYPFLGYEVAARGNGPQVVGAVLAAFGVGWVVGQLLCGWLVDRIGRRATLMSAMLLATVVLCGLAWVHSVPAMMAGAMLAGLVYDAPRPVLGAAIADLIPDPEKRARVDAFRFGWVINVGAAVTGGVGGLLADNIGIPALYLINAAAAALFGLLAFFAVPPDSPGASAPSTASYRVAFADRRLVVLLASSVATLTALMGLVAVMPMLMSARGLSAGAYGLAQLGNALAVVAVTPLLTPWLSRQLAGRPRLDILAAAAMWATVCTTLIALAQSTLEFTLAAAAGAPGEIAWFMVGANIVHRIAPARHRGFYHGLWGMALAVAAVLSPILAAYSLGHGGQPLVAATTLAAGILGAALCFPLARQLADSHASHPVPAAV